ncbi:MAG TPA: DUF5995 family protein [Acidimicrobiales bacterium]|nr:DUF5995 family protein [Acidimicrobiales bacterium]
MSEPTTFDDTIGALDTLVDECSKTGDRIGYFAAMYIAVTDTIRERSEAGRFQDPARMARFVSCFAARYLDALNAWRVGEPCSQSWLVAFRAAQEWRPIILQHLLLGMNAHINLDLGVTVCEVAEGSSIEAERADFDAVNDVLGQLVDGCQGALDKVSPWLGLVDRIGGRGDETLIRFSIGAARSQAWSVALRLSSLAGPERAAAIGEVDATTARIAQIVEHPGLPASALLLAVRARERAAPADVMDVLRAVRPDEP